MKEEWKSIDETNGFYEISNFGNVRTIDRYVRVCGNGKRLLKGQKYKPVVCSNGYLELQANVYGKRHIFMIHRLVAKYFIPNPYDYPEVNHKDENPQNNHVDNLEWCTPKYNCNYGTRNKRCREKVIKKSVIQLSLDGDKITTYSSIIEAEKNTGVDSSQIIRVCKGTNKTAGGYKWKYA